MVAPSQTPQSDDRARLKAAVVAALGQIARDEQDAANPESLAHVIYQTWLASYQATLTAEAARAGQPGVVKLTDPDVLASLRTYAETTAQDILQTQHDDAVMFTETLPTDVAASAAPAEIVRHIQQRDLWKVPQVAITETAKAVGTAQRAFIERSHAKGFATFGGSSTCDLCQSIGAGNPYPLDDPTVGYIPHPSCGDWWETTYTSIDDPWTGD